MAAEHETEVGDREGFDPEDEFEPQAGGAGEAVPGLDPRLDDLLEAWHTQTLTDSDSVRGAKGATPAVEVLAELHDPDQQVPGLDVERQNGNLITGTVEASQILAVRTHPNVKGLQMARPLHQELATSVPEIRATTQQIRDALPAGSPDIDGSGVIVGIVDYGCDFVHRNFRHEDGKTRLLYLWNQAEADDPRPPSGFGYGREYTAAEINQALLAAKPYETLGYGPGGEERHGTHVLDIAAGNGRATGNPGVAPGADLVFVHVSTADAPAHESLGNSRRLLDAVDYVFDKATELGKSAVINISLGTHGGPHDGSTYAERWFDGRLSNPGRGRAIVMSAGNYRKKGCHASGDIAAGGSRTLTWEIAVDDETYNELEIWYEDGSLLEVTVTGPTGQRFGPQALNQLPLRYKRGNTTVVRITNQRDDYGDNKIDIFLHESLDGQFQVKLQNAGSVSTSFHAWIERDDPDHQSRFAAGDRVTSHTLGSIASGEHTIAVASYDAVSAGKTISDFSSEGPTRDGKQKPQVSAPGHWILAANSMTQGAIKKPGTSMAAPHVTGLVALLMQAADRQEAGRKLTIAEIRDAVVASARKNPPPGSGWHACYGNGRVDGVATVLTQFP